MIEVKFEGIDYWSRPVFKDVKSNRRYGSVDKLFRGNTSLRTIDDEVTESDLCFFGMSFDCEPDGDKITGPFKILKGGVR